MKVRMASNIQPDSIVDGEGIRTVVWMQGCSHNCPGCQNPTTHDFKGGYDEDIENIKEELANLKGQDGITLSGGDPMFQPKATMEIAKFAKSIGLNVWCYTGFLYEDILINEKQNKVLDYIDVLVDGKFKIEEFSLNLQFKGSKNQRVIDVVESKKQGYVCLVKKYKEEKDYNNIYQKQEYMFI